MNILRNLFDLIGGFFLEIVFGCRHDHLTRPFTLERQTYKVCLDCGRQIFYSADTMRPLSAREVRRRKAADEILAPSAALGAGSPIRSQTGAPTAQTL